MKSGSPGAQGPGRLEECTKRSNTEWHVISSSALGFKLKLRLGLGVLVEVDFGIGVR